MKFLSKIFIFSLCFLLFFSETIFAGFSLINASEYKLTISYLGLFGSPEEVLLCSAQEYFIPDRVAFLVRSRGCSFYFTEDVFECNSGVYQIKLHLKRRFKRNRETGEKKCLGRSGVCEIFYYDYLCDTDRLCAREVHKHLVFN